MRKKLLIAAAVVIVLGVIYSIYDYNKLTAQGKEIDALWPKSAEAYKARLAVIDKLKAEVKDGMAQDQKAVMGLEKAEADLKDASGISEQIPAINAIEKNTANLIVALDKYPDLKNSADTTADVAKLTEKGSEKWMNPYNDQAVQYNIAIHRIRNRAVASMFGIKPKETVGPASDHIKAVAEKAAKKTKKTKSSSSTDDQSGE